MALTHVSSKKYNFPFKRPKLAPPTSDLEPGNAANQNNTMGLVYAKVELINGDDLALFKRGYLKETEIRSMEVEFLVDTCAYMLVINETICQKLGLVSNEKRPAQLANGEIVYCDVVGPIEVRFANRRSILEAMVLPGDSEPLFGAIPMEDMDLVVEPRAQRLTVNPEHPLEPQMSLK